MSLLPDVSIGVWACVNSPGDQRGVYSAKLVNQFALDLLLGKYKCTLSKRRKTVMYSISAALRQHPGTEKASAVNLEGKCERWSH